MKANWKFAIVALATLAMVACNPNKSTEPDKPQQQDTTVTPPAPQDTTVTPPPSGPFKSKISVTDNSSADWENVPAEYLVESECPDDAMYLGLKWAKIYADAAFINILVAYDPDELGEDLSWIPFHVYLDVDNDPTTGGFNGQLSEGNADVLLETGILADGAHNPWNPSVSKWWGDGVSNEWIWSDPSKDHDASDFWGAEVGEGQLPIGNSQELEGNIFEIQLMRELIPHEFANEFGLALDIQDAGWSSVGMIPQGSATDDGAVYGPILKIKIDPAK